MFGAGSLVACCCWFDPSLTMIMISSPGWAVVGASEVTRPAGWLEVVDEGGGVVVDVLLVWRVDVPPVD